MFEQSSLDQLLPPPEPHVVLLQSETEKNVSIISFVLRRLLGLVCFPAASNTLPPPPEQEGRLGSWVLDTFPLELRALPHPNF